MAGLLHSPARHAPLAGEAWSDARARGLIRATVADLESDYDAENAAWPNHPGDLEGDPDLHVSTVYLGAAGIVYALRRLAEDGHAGTALDLDAIAAGLYERWLAAPEFTSLYPAPHPSLLMGAAGLLLVGGQDPEALAAAIAANERNPTRELLWGSPGTMLAALAAGEDDLFRSSAAWLLAQRGDDGLWEQDMYGSRDRYVGPGHGFAGNVFVLLRGRALLDPGVAADVERSAVDVLVRLAERDGGVVRWPATVGERMVPDELRVQWCHGSPGIVIALGAVLERDDTVDELLIGGGELTWAAGPLRANASLCHGTAGNGYAFLRLFERTGDELWLERARAFAMHASAQARAAREATGPRCPLFTGEAGVALFLAACLTGDPRFPFLD